jgi:hypothetical protein
MSIQKTVRLLFTFYYNFCAATIIVTLCCAYMFSKLGPDALTAIIWFKLFTLATIFFYINSYKKKEFYYYQNLGISKQRLWVCTLVFDLMLFIFSLTLS